MRLSWLAPEQVAMAKKGKKKDSHEERLIHSSTKLLHRAVKKSKAFEVKKAIRKLKEAAGNEARCASCEALVEKAKGVDVDKVVAVALRRCGVAHVGPEGAHVVAAVAGDAAAARVGAHKLVVAAAREVDERATSERRRALLKADPRLRAEDRAERATKKKLEEKEMQGFNVLNRFYRSLNTMSHSANRTLGGQSTCRTALDKRSAVRRFRCPVEQRSLFGGVALQEGVKLVTLLLLVFVLVSSFSFPLPLVSLPKFPTPRTGGSPPAFPVHGGAPEEIFAEFTFQRMAQEFCFRDARVEKLADEEVPRHNIPRRTTWVVFHFQLD